MNTLAHEFDIGDKVAIAASPDIKGHVVGICKRIYGMTYCVCWWIDGKRNEEWLHEREIAAAG